MNLYSSRAKTRRTVHELMHGAASTETGGSAGKTHVADDRTCGFDAQVFSWRHRLLVNLAHAMIMVGVMGLALLASQA